MLQSSHVALFTYRTLFSFSLCLSLFIFSSGWTFFMLHFFRVALFSCCILLLLHFLHAALFPYRTLFIFRYVFHFSFFLRAAPFPCFTFFVLHSFCVALFLCCILFMLHFFSVSLFSCFVISMLHFLRVALFSCCTAISNFFSEQIFCRNLRSDCLFFMCCVNLVIRNSIKSFSAE